MSRDALDVAIFGFVGSTGSQEGLESQLRMNMLYSPALFANRGPSFETKCELILLFRQKREVDSAEVIFLNISLYYFSYL